MNNDILEWNPELETGIKKVDDQHKELFKRIYRIKEAVKKGTSAKEVYTTLVFFKRYVIEHFKDEEELQKQSGYPDYEKHKLIHSEFMKRVEELFDKITEEEVTLMTILEVNKTVYDWLSEHIFKVDKDFAKYYRNER